MGTSSLWRGREERSSESANTRLVQEKHPLEAFQVCAKELVNSPSRGTRKKLVAISFKPADQRQNTIPNRKTRKTERKLIERKEEQ